MCGELIGPYILSPRFNAVPYLNYLREVLLHLLDNIPLEIRSNLWYTCDGAPCHSVI
jgi:hypothetical protein